MQQKISYVLSILLVLLIATPVSAAVTPGINSLFSATIPDGYESVSAVSSKNELLMAVSGDAYDEQLDDWVYSMDLYKIQPNEAKKVSTLYNVQVVFAQRSDHKVFMFALHDEEAKIDVYDENFQLVDTYALSNPAPFINYDVYQHEQYVHITSDEGASFVYDLQTLTHVQSVAFPTVSAASTGDGIQLLDALGQIQQTLSFETLIQKERYNRAYIDENSIAVTSDRITFAYVQEEMIYTNGFEDSKMNWYIATSDYTGHILHKKLIPTSQDFYDFPEFLAAPNGYKIFTNSEKVDGYANIRTYNPQTGVLSNAQSFSKPFDYIWQKRDDYFFAPLNFDEIGVYKTANQRLQYTLKQTDAHLADISNAYGIVSGEAANEDYTAFHFTLFDLVSGKTVKTFKAYDVQLVQNDFLVETNIHDDEQQTVTLHQLQTNNLRPTTYAPSKMWTVTFNDAVDKATVTDKSVYVLNAQGHEQDVTLRVSGKQIFVDAPSALYEEGEYTLYIKEVSSINGLALKTEKTHAFTISK